MLTAAPTHGTFSDPLRVVTQIADRVARSAALRSERVISLCRIILCCALLVRFLLIDERMPLGAYVLNMSALGVGGAFSLLVLLQRGFTSAGVLAAACIVDAVVCFLSLLQTVLWTPVTHGYRGLLSVPDPCVIPILTFAAAFRLSPRLSGLSGGLNAMSSTALLVLDELRFGHRPGYGSAQWSLFGIVVVLAWVAAVLLARQARQLALSAAMDVVRVENARGGIAELLREQHDARSLLSAATLNADLFRQALQSAVNADSSRVARWLAEFKVDLAAASARMQQLGERVFAELSSIREREPVRTADVLPRAVDLIAARFPEVKLEADLGSLPEVRLAGGASSLQRLLLNLIANAVEGDGARGATRVRIATELAGSHLALLIEDDGPGFAPDPGLEVCLTTKATGSGLGLFAVRRILEASGGSLSQRSNPAGGAVVVASIPLEASS
jgi:signal transduction histidine kinase